MAKTKVYLSLEYTDDLWFDPVANQKNSELASLTGIWNAGFSSNPLPKGYRPETRGKGRTLIDPSVLLEESEVLKFFPNLETMRKSVFISGNMKTFASLNLRINGTEPLRSEFKRRFSKKTAETLLKRIPKVGASCRPTEWCTVSCYAKAGRMVGDAMQRQYLANLLHFDHMKRASVKDLNQSIDAVYKTMMLNWTGMPVAFRPNLRLMGSGDLVPGLIRWINAFAKRHPDFLLWGMSRRPDLVSKLNRRENIVFQPSVDYTTPISKRAKGAWPVSRLWKITKARGWNLCYATEKSAQDILQLMRSKGMEVKTVFGYHGKNRMTEVGDPYECPATSAALKKTLASLSQGVWHRRRISQTIQRAPRLFPYAPGYEGGKDFNICQVCRWCMTPNLSKRGKTREEVLGRRFPKEILTDPYFQSVLSPIQSNPVVSAGVKFERKATADQERMPLFFRG
jgi:hypothetical protein